MAKRGTATSPEVALRLWLPAGEAQIRYWDRDSVAIEAGLGPKAQLVGGVAGSAGTYAVEFVDPTSEGLPQAKVILTVPRRATVWVKSTTASVVVTGGAGQLDVLTVSGRTMVRDAAGIVTVESIEGDVEAWRTAGPIRIRGGAGDVSLNEVSGRVDVTMVSGGIDVNRADVSRYTIPGGRLETVSGAIRIRGVMSPGSGLDIGTHDGSIDLLFFEGTLPEFFVDRRRQPTVDAQLAKLGGPVRGRSVFIHSFKGALNIGVIPGIK
jgi:hypothetical protein